MKIIKTKDSIVIPDPSGSLTTFYKRENLTKEEMNILEKYLGVYRRKKFIIFGKKEYYIPNEVIKYLSSELY